MFPYLCTYFFFFFSLLFVKKNVFEFLNLWLDGLRRIPVLGLERYIETTIQARDPNVRRKLQIDKMRKKNLEDVLKLPVYPLPENAICIEG